MADSTSQPQYTPITSLGEAPDLNFVRQIIYHLLRNGEEAIYINSKPYRRGEVKQWVFNTRNDIRSALGEVPPNLLSPEKEPELFSQLLNKITQLELEELNLNTNRLDAQHLDDLVKANEARLAEQALESTRRTNLIIPTADTISVAQQQELFRRQKLYELERIRYTQQQVEPLTKQLTHAVVTDPYFDNTDANYALAQRNSQITSQQILAEVTQRLNQTELSNLTVRQMSDLVEEAIVTVQANSYEAKTILTPKVNASIKQSVIAKYTPELTQHIQQAYTQSNAFDWQSNQLLAPADLQLLAHLRTESHQYILNQLTTGPKMRHMVDAYQQLGLNREQALAAAIDFDASTSPIDNAFVAAGEMQQTGFGARLKSGRYGGRLVQSLSTKALEYKLFSSKFVTTTDGSTIAIKQLPIGNKLVSSQKLLLALNKQLTLQGKDLVSQGDLLLALMGEDALNKLLDNNANFAQKLYETTGVQLHPSSLQMLGNRHHQTLENIQIVIKNNTSAQDMANELGVPHESVRHLFYSQISRTQAQKEAFEQVINQIRLLPTHDATELMAEVSYQQVGQSLSRYIAEQHGWNSQNVIIDIVSDYGHSWINQGVRQTLTKGSRYLYAGLESYATQKGLLGFGAKALKGGIDFGVKIAAGFAAKLGFKGLAAGLVNAIPVLGQVVSAAMVIDMAMDAIEAIPVIGQLAQLLPIFAMRNQLKQWGGKALKWGALGLGALGGLALSGLTSLMGWMGGLWSGMGLFSAGTLLSAVSPLLGIPLQVAGGSMMGYSLASKLGGLLKGGLGNTLNGLHSAWNSLLSSTGLASSYTAAPLIALGTVAGGSIITMQVLISAFALPPFETLNNIETPTHHLSELEPGMPQCFPTLGAVTAGNNVITTGDEASHMHNNAIDIGSVNYSNGQPIYATHDGIVTQSGEHTTNGVPDGFGISVTLSSPESQTPSFSTLYAHLLTGSNIANNTVVKRGDIIGRMNSTGNSTGPHLHYQLIGVDYSITDTLLLAGCITQEQATKIETGCLERTGCGVTITKTANDI